MRGVKRKFGCDHPLAQSVVREHLLCACTHPHTHIHTHTQTRTPYHGIHMPPLLRGTHAPPIMVYTCPPPYHDIHIHTDTHVPPIMAYTWPHLPGQLRAVLQHIQVLGCPEGREHAAAAHCPRRLRPHSHQPPQQLGHTRHTAAMLRSISSLRKQGRGRAAEVFWRVRDEGLVGQAGCRVRVVGFREQGEGYMV